MTQFDMLDWAFGLVHFTNALLGRWLWPYATETYTLWRTVVVIKCGNELGALILGVLKEPYGGSLEKHMGGSLMFCQVIGRKWLPCSFWA